VAPWYRQFWPWFIIALPTIVVAASLYTLILANLHADDLVIDEYYKEGLAINLLLERDAQADKLGLHAELYLSGQNQLQIGARIQGDIQASQLMLRLSHPMEAAEDRELILKRVGDEDYMTTINTPLSGNWYWILDAGDSSTWRLTGEQRF